MIVISMPLKFLRLDVYSVMLIHSEPENSYIFCLDSFQLFTTSKVFLSPENLHFPVIEVNNVHEEYTLLCPACDLHSVTLIYLGITLIPRYCKQTKKMVEINQNPDFENKYIFKMKKKANR